MRSGIQKLNKKQLRGGVVVLVLAVLVAVGLIGGAVAKYIHSNQGENIVESTEFYFSSNLLLEENVEYKINANSKSLTFTLGNNIDSLRYSQDDVYYEISVEGNAVLSQTEGVLVKNGVSTTTVTLSGLENGKTYTVTAVGTAGYKKTLSATFKVEDSEKKAFKYLDASNDAYVLLTVWTENVSGKAKIEFSENGLIPDNTDPVMENVFNFESGVYTPISFEDSMNFNEAYSSYTYRFFIDDVENISVDMFTVTIDEAYEAYEKTPS